MNKIYKTTYGIAILLLMVLTSCMKQNLGEYTPEKVNDLTINGSLKDAYVVNVDDVLKLDASAEQSLGNGELSYKWYYYSNATSTATTIDAGNTAQLLLKINMATGSYVLVAESTDQKTGIKAYKKIALTVKRMNSEGWLLLTWKNNITNLSIVSSENDVLRNFLIPSSTYPILSKPEKLYCLNYPGPKIQPIAIKTGQSKLFWLNRNTFEVNSDENDAFASGQSPVMSHFDADLYFFSYYLWDTDGLVYRTNGGPDANYPSLFDQPMGGNYKASKFTLSVRTGSPITTVFYDELSKGFMYQAYGGNQLLPFQKKPVDAPFNMSSFTDEIKFTDAGASDKTYVVGRNSRGEHNLYTMDLNKALDIYPAMAVDKLDIPTNVTPSFYAVSGKLPLLYYIIDNSIYLYKMGEKKSLPALYTFPADEKIVAFKMFRETLLMNEAKNPFVNNRLVVAVNKGEEGVLYTFDLSATGALKTGRYATRNDGFDTIIDIAYKEFR